ncbi:MAG: phosphatidate cytidylyltransferase [Flavobacteriales bacterium]|jgi:phosphatidate cytidylyltransferase
MSDLLKRFLTAVVAGFIFLGAVFGGQLTYSLLFGLVIVLGLWEYFDLVEKSGFKAQRLLGLIVGSTLFVTDILVHFYGKPIELFLLPLVVLFFTMPVELYRNRKDPFINIALGLFGLLYFALPITLLNHVVQINHVDGYDPMFLLAFFMLIWASDTGAYFAGINFGKHKLFERVSPKKTWEGAAGGVILSLIIGACFAYGYPVMEMWKWMVLSIIASIAGIYGDLVESLLKRNVGVKDSGSILPGHGGVLDRFDSILLATPPAFVFLQLFF